MRTLAAILATLALAPAAMADDVATPAPDDGLGSGTPVVTAVARPALQRPATTHKHNRRQQSWRR